MGVQFSNSLFKRTSLACATGLADTLCPPETPWVTLVNYKGDSISKYVCSTVDAQ